MLDLLFKFGPYLAAGLLAVFGGFKLYGAGKKTERAKQDRARVEAIEEANQIQNDIGAMPPDEARKDLKKWAR